MIRKTLITRGLIFIWWFCKGHTKETNLSAYAELFPLHQCWHNLSHMKKNREKRKNKALHAFSYLYIACERRQIFAFQYQSGSIWLWQQHWLCGAEGKNVRMICWGYLLYQVSQTPSAATVSHRLQIWMALNITLLCRNLIFEYTAEQENTAQVNIKSGTWHVM